MSQAKSKCSRCNGSGIIPCPGCQGSGRRSLEERSGKATKIVNCAGCQGRGIVPCGVCGGAGEK